MRYGRSPTSSMNRMCPRGGSNAYGVPSDASSCVSVPPTQHARGLAGRERLERGVRELAERLGARQSTRVNVSRS